MELSEHRHTIEAESQMIKRVSEAISEGSLEQSANIIQQEHPFLPRESITPSYNKLASMEIFMRDGFIDRYFGTQLVFPGALRIISLLLPTIFPYHPNWKMTECHIAWWHLYPTIDHITPVALGGSDAEINLVTTSMLHNNVKSNWTLDEVGWKLVPEGKRSQWDGLTGWFLEQIASNPNYLKTPYIKLWYNAAQNAGVHNWSS